jgi:hypothetical protein
MAKSKKSGLQRLQEAYFSASIHERYRLRPKLARKMHETYPGPAEMVDRMVRNGDYLMLMFKQGLTAALSKPNLDPRGRTDALEGAGDFMAAFEELKRADPRVRETALELATDALFTGLRAGLNPDEVEKLQKRARTELSRKGGMALKREKPWEADVKKIAKRAAAKNAKASNPRLVEAILAECSAQGKKPPASDRTLLRRIAKWRRMGDLPLPRK